MDKVIDTEINLMTVKEVSKLCNIPISSLRNFIHKKVENGFSMCMSQDSSRTILIDSKLFEEWRSKRVRKAYDKTNRISTSSESINKRRYYDMKYYDNLGKIMNERDYNGEVYE